MYVESRKMVQMNLFAGQNRDAYVGNRCVDMRWGGGGMNCETGIDVLALPCVKQIASGNLLHNAGSSAWCSGDLDGWDGGVVRGRSKREGIYVYI